MKGIKVACGADPETDLICIIALSIGCAEWIGPLQMCFIRYCDFVTTWRHAVFRAGAKVLGWSVGLVIDGQGLLLLVMHLVRGVLVVCSLELFYRFGGRFDIRWSRTTVVEWLSWSRVNWLKLTCRLYWYYYCYQQRAFASCQVR